MSESVVGVDDGTDKFLHTDQRTISSTAKESQFVLEEEAVRATYSAIATSVSTATSSSHMLSINGDGTNYVRLRRLNITQTVAAGAATLANIQIVRISTLASGGGAITARPYDAGDSAFGGTAQSLPSSKGTEGTVLWIGRLWLTNSIAAQPNTIEWVARSNMKPIIFGTATTDGIVIKIATGIASGQVDVSAEFTVSSYL